MPFLEREGTFHAKPFSVEIRGAADPTSYSENAWVKFKVIAELVGEQWVKLTDMLDIQGMFCLAGRDGKPMDKTIEMLRQAWKWNGKLDALRAEKLPECSIRVERDRKEYKGVYQLRVRSVNRAGYGGPPTADRLAEIQAKLDGTWTPTARPQTPTAETVEPNVPNFGVQFTDSGEEIPF